jgi:hypothetical protein
MLPQLIDTESQLTIAKRHAEDLREEWRIANAVQDRPCGPAATQNLLDATGHAVVRLGRRLLAVSERPRRSTARAHPIDSGC